MKRLMRDDRRHAELAHVLDMAREVGEALLQRLDVLLAELVLGDAAMHLERAHGGDDDRGGRLQARLAALDVEELLGAEVGAEAGLGHHVVAELQRRAWWRSPSCSHGRCWRTGRHGRRPGCSPASAPGSARCASFSSTVIGAVGLEVAGVDRLLVAGVADDDVAEAAGQVLEVAWPGRRSPSLRRRR